MIVELNCSTGGRPMSGYGKFVIDKDSGVAGYQIGYSPSGEKIIIPLRDIKKFRRDMKIGLEKDVKEKSKPLKYKIGEWLLGVEPKDYSEPKRVKIGDKWVTIDN